MSVGASPRSQTAQVAMDNCLKGYLFLTFEGKMWNHVERLSVSKQL